MAFPFFKKKETDTATRTASSGPAQGAPVAPAVFTDETGLAGGIEVHSSGELLSAAEEQAAILHANGASQKAMAILLAELSAIRGLRRQETWLMLFELYQQTGDPVAHEALGLEYVVEFEKTPPIWNSQRVQHIQRGLAAGNLCSFGPVLSVTTIDAELLPLRRAAASFDTLRLDFSRVREIDALAAAELLAIWHTARKTAVSCQISGGTPFAALLAGKIETGRRIPAEAPFWLLLMELYQASGQQDIFENLAVEYAITFEVSPPSWDERLAPLPQAFGQAAAAMPDEETSRDGICPAGSITGDRPGILAEIRDQARNSAGTLTLDFSLVDRIDFESAGQLLNLCMEMLQAGRNIRITQVNELVFALLQLMGIAEFAALERRKS